MSTEVLFLLPAEYGIFWKTYGIPPDSAEFRGIFTVKFVYGIPQVTKWSRFQIPPRIKKKLLNKFYCISIFNAKKLVKEYSSEGLINLYFQYIHVLHCWVRNFYRTPAGYTTDRKTRRKRDMGCYGLLSATSHPLLHLPHLSPSQYSTGNALWTIVYNLWTSPKYTNAGYFLMVFGKSKDDNRIHNMYISLAATCH